jgi:small-conductance mechanosensitive channel
MHINLLIAAGVSSGIIIFVLSEVIGRWMAKRQPVGLIRSWLVEIASDVRWLGKVIAVTIVIFIPSQNIKALAIATGFILKISVLIFGLLLTIAFVEQATTTIRKNLKESSKVSQRDKTNLLTLVPLAASGLKYVIYFCFFVIVLAACGVNILPVLGASAIAFGAIALASQHILQDMISTLSIFTDRLYGHGTIVKFPGNGYGVVDKVTWRWTFVKIGDKTLVIANRKVDMFWLDERD